LGVATVFADAAAANANAEQRQPEDAAAFSYLKEQQWTNTFAAEPVREHELRASIRVPATIEPLTGGQAIMSAPAAGRFAADTLIRVGTAVTAGQILGRLEPRQSDGTDRATLASDVAEAGAAMDAARADLARAERLLAERAVPGRRVDDARRVATVAEARWQSAQARLAQRDQVLGEGGGGAAGNAFQLRAPIAGRVVSVTATLGAAYDAGTPLFKIVRTDRVELRALVPPGDLSVVRDVAGLAFEAPGRREPIALTPEHQHDAGVLDPQTRALPIQFEVANPGGQLVVGESGNAVLFQKALTKTPAVPKSAVLYEASRPYVFVQLSGESFARRYLEIAAADGDWLGVRSGLSAGERVVTRGAFEVQLASASTGLPAEGHVH